MILKKLVKFLFIILTVFSFKSIAQPYSTGIGLRLGGISSGITIKHFINSNNALEGILGFGHESIFVTGLYEKHQPFPKAEGLSWFFGGGAHIGFYNNNYGEYYYYKHHGNKVIITDHYDSNVSFGGDFIIGMDYKFKDAPVNIALDVKPFFDIFPGFYGYWEGALTVRFTL